MDHANRFLTTLTYRMLRAEYGVGLVVCLALFVLHIDEIRWLPAILLFAYIDVIGYLPGAIAHVRAKDAPIPRIYYILYNTMHSLVTQCAVLGLWVWILGFEWALLVVPIHLFGDRALFGNFVKSFRVPFEPKVVPEFAEFEDRLADRLDGAPTSLGSQLTTASG